MSRTDFVPARDEAFNAWAVNFSALITASPTTYGLIAADATTLAGLVTDFSTSLETAVTPSTRTTVSIAAKNTARAILTLEVRALVKRIQSTPTVTAAEKLALGISVADRVYSPVPAPTTKPVLNLLANSGRTHTIRLVDEATPTRRARPDGSAGAEVYSYVAADGEAPPADLEKWRFEGLATKREFNISYNGEDINKTAHIRACWFNRRGESGPVSEQITASIAA